VEKLIVSRLQKQMKDDLTPDLVLMNVNSDFRDIFTKMLNLMLLDASCFLNLPNEEWAIKLMVNVLTNSGL